MNLIDSAYERLFKKPSEYTSNIKYSGRFKGFNANIRLKKEHIDLSMSKKWQNIDNEIKIGLIQCLLLKIFKKKGNTKNIDLYNNFIRSVYIAIPKKEPPKVLRKSFERVNKKFFNNMMDIPNIKFGNGANRLGTYDYGTDTITISRKLLCDEPALDYVMYHEMLHKKHKFKVRNNRNYHHTREFRKRERAFPNSEAIEKKLGSIAKRNRVKRWIWPI